MNIRTVRGWLVRLGGVFGRARRDRELAEELESHLAMHVDDNLRAGMPHDEARRQALLKLGGVEPAKEAFRAQRGLPTVEAFAKDLRYGGRRLAKSPGFSLVAIASLALGIGANTAIFSMLNTAALRPLPIERPNEVVALMNGSGNRMFSGFSYPNYRDIRDRSDVFAGVIGYRFAPLSLSHDGLNERLWGYVVTGNYFDVLGVRPALGRALTPDDDGQPGGHPVAMVSYDSWQHRFGGDPAIVGKELIVNGRAYTVVGVAPQGFFGTEIIAAPEMWFPMSMQAQIEVGNDWLERRDVENLFVQARVKPGVGVARVQTALETIAGDLEREYPDVNEGMHVQVTTAGFMGGSTMRGTLLGFTGLLMVVVAFVLLLACTNLANLLLARATERRREISVRLALGASRLRVVWQLLAESMLLSLVSGAIGLLIATWIIGVAAGYKPPLDVPFFVDLRVDYRVLAFTCAISLATGMLFGLLPALQATKLDLLTALKDETSFASARRSWWKSALIVFQVALSLVLLVGGGLTVRALQRAETLDLGFDPQHAAEVSFDLRLQGYDVARGRQFQKDLVARVQSLPGVRYAGIVDLVPVDLHFSRTVVFVDGQPDDRVVKAPRAMSSRIGPGYLQAMNTRILKGRDFADSDDVEAPPVVIVNEALARTIWPGEDPIGKRLRVGSEDSPLREVVGVVEDGKYAGLNETPQPYVCRPMAQSYSGSTTLVARTDGDPRAILSSLRGELLGLDPTMPISSAKPLVDRMAMPLLPARIAASVLGSFGLVALALAAIGIYGVMSNSVARRTREIGVRVALGAQTSDVQRLVIWQGMALVLLGVAIGLAAALGLMQLATSVLFGVSATDPLTYVAVAALLIAVATLAAYVPARRTTKIDPIVALRSE